MKDYNLYLEHDFKSGLLPTHIKNGQAIGIEIECVVPFASCWGIQSLAQEFARADILSADIATDGSIYPPDGYFGAEIRVLCSYDNKTNLKEICALLKKMKAKVNKSCGLHVHLDCRDLDNGKDWEQTLPAKVVERAKRLANALPLLFGMAKKSRLDNEFCYPIMSKEKYSAINMGSYFSRQTVEVRLYHSTLSYLEISRWVDILYSISRQPVKGIVSSAKQLNRIKMPRDLKVYIQRKAKPISFPKAA